MAKADRLERMDIRRAELETEYLETLIASLEVTAAGSWGLFDHNRDRRSQAKIAPIVASLCELADAIDHLRVQLELEAFALHREFLDARGPVSTNAVGEPKQARAWLDELAKASTASGG